MPTSTSSILAAHLLGGEGAERRRDHAADQQPDRRGGEGGPAERGDEGRRDGQGEEEFGGVDGADHLARIGALDEQIAGHHRPPAAAAGRVEEAAGKAERLDDLRVLVLVRRIMEAAPDQIEADQAR